MVKTIGDEAYKELIYLKLPEIILKNNENKMVILNRLFSTINIFKMSYYEFCSLYPEDALYVLYLLQTNSSIDFSLCEMFKMWCNQNGWQYGCAKDKGMGKRIQVKCKGDLNNCDRK